MSNEPNWGPLGQTVYERTYKRGNETWKDTVARVVRGNLALVDEKHHETDEADRLQSLIESFALLPAGRHLWASGSESGLGLYNCHRAGFGPGVSDHFTFLFDQLMLGGGVGANYSYEYLNPLPSLGNVTVRHYPQTPNAHAHNNFVVDDSREGWISALQALFDTAMSSDNDLITYDTSLVRPAGSPILGFGGTASGPAPLCKMLDDVATIINGLSHGKMTPLDAMDIDHAIASCVIAGNVRRSARMSIIHWKDPFLFQFLGLKADTQSHWSTNISVEVDTAFWDAIERNDDDAVGVLNVIIEAMLENGEPGFFNSSLASEGERGDVRSTNPCGEIALEASEPCVLGHVNLAHFGTDLTGAAEAVRLMTRFLIRATLSSTSDAGQRAVLDRNHRIGVGLFGVQEWAAAHGVRWSEIPDSGDLYLILKSLRMDVKLAEGRYAASLGIHRPIKSTTIAPTGTIAKLPGVSEGIHPIYAKHFIQRIRYASTDPNLPTGYVTEPCQYSANTTVVEIPTRNAILDRFPAELIQSVDELTVDCQLRVQRFFQEHWADNAVSFTVNLSQDTAFEDVFLALAAHGPMLKGTTVFPDQSRPQAPYERVSEQVYSEWEQGTAYDECASGACPIR